MSRNKITIASLLSHVIPIVFIKEHSNPPKRSNTPTPPPYWIEYNILQRAKCKDGVCVKQEEERLVSLGYCQTFLWHAPT